MKIKVRITGNEKMHFLKFQDQLLELVGLKEKAREVNGEVVKEYMGYVYLEEEDEVEALRELGKDNDYKVVKVAR